MELLWIVGITTLVVAAIFFILGRKSRNHDFERVNQSILTKNNLLGELKAVQRALEVDSQTKIQRTEATLARCKSNLNTANAQLEKLDQDKKQLHDFISETLNKLRSESSVLPYAIRWFIKLQEAVDNLEVKRIAAPPHPAPSAAIQVQDAKAETRRIREETELLRNRIDLYERQAPWLTEFAQYTLEEIIEGLKEEEAIRKVYAVGDDPTRLFLSATEWSSLAQIERNQLALDRYWQGSRNRTAWVAGTQYERYVGYKFESKGFNVEYHGALERKQDLGIDLICKKNAMVHIIQCKRLSPIKQIPVRENVVAQIYGTAMFYALIHKLDRNHVMPAIYTTYELSSQAKDFAEMLGVTTRENFAFEKYPCIKCNISKSTGERIYHFPFDQQYDRTLIGNVPDEFYAMTVAEAEKAKFRRALKWRSK
jgi:hypothetical protein